MANEEIIDAFRCARVYFTNAIGVHGLDVFVKEEITDILQSGIDEGFDMLVKRRRSLTDGITAAIESRIERGIGQMIPRNPRNPLNKEVMEGHINGIKKTMCHHTLKGVV